MPQTAQSIHQAAQHTPGPWEVMDTDETLGGMEFMPVAHCADDPTRCRQICHVVAGDDGDQFRVSVTDQANANLIATAPELLALAEQYAEECAECDGTGEVNTLTDAGNLGATVPCPDCADIRAVIAKAVA